jgi:hypothetical protein
MIRRRERKQEDQIRENQMRNDSSRYDTVLFHKYSGLLTDDGSL